MIVLPTAVDQEQRDPLRPVALRLFGRDLGDEIAAVWIVEVGSRLTVDLEPAQQRPAQPYPFREGPRVDAREPRDAHLPQPCLEAAVRAVVREVLGVRGADDPGGVDPARLPRSRRQFARGAARDTGHSIIPHGWKGKRQDLAAVGRVGEGFRVADHPGREHHLAGRGDRRSERHAGEHRAVLKDQPALRRRARALPACHRPPRRALAYGPGWARRFNGRVSSVNRGAG